MPHCIYCCQLVLEKAKTPARRRGFS
jgi:hypothetical protein